MDLSERGAEPTDRHPWEQARARFIRRTMLAPLDRAAVHRVLDVGAGDAWLCGQIRLDFPDSVEYTAWYRHYSYQDLATLPRASNVRLVRELDRRQYDLVMLFDVLEHIEDDAGFLARLVQEHLAPGGHALVTVPAQPWLFTLHDTALHHFRRYTPRTIRPLLAAAGLEVLRSGGLFHSLVAPRAAIKMKEALFPDSRARTLSDWNHGRATTAVFSAALAADTWVSAHTAWLPWSLPGTSWWAVCQKP